MEARYSNPIGAMGAGMEVGARATELRRQRELEALFQQHGAGIIAGDQGALNAFAAMNPEAALGVRQSLHGMATTDRQLDQADYRLGQQDQQIGLQREGLALDRERLELSRQQGAQEMQRFLMSMERQISADQQEQARFELAQAAQQTQAAVAELYAIAEAGPEAWAERSGAVLQRIGEEPVPFDQAAEVIGRESGEYKVVQDFLQGQSGGSEQTTAFQTLDQRAQAAGMQPGTPEYQAFMAEGGTPDAGISFRGPDGTELRIGGPTQDGARVDPTSTDSMLSTIDGILTDPALDWATGMSSVTQQIPGTGAYRAGTRIDQLRGQAFLQAYNALRGGGQITENEGRKAEQAMARLQPGQRTEDFVDAILDLREVVNAARTRAGQEPLPLPEGFERPQLQGSGFQPVVPGPQAEQPPGGSQPQNFAGMDVMQLSEIDPATLPPEQLAAYNAALMAILGRDNGQ